MSGRLGDVAGGDDATAAELRPPAGMAHEQEAESEAEEDERTVQSIAAASPAAASVDAPPPRPAAGAPASSSALPAATPPPRPASSPRAITAISPGAQPPPPPSTVAPVPPTSPSARPVSSPVLTPPPSSPVSAVASTEPDPAPRTIATSEEEDPITATAPRVSAIPGTVAVASASTKNDDLLDETEVKTMAGARPGRAPDPPRRKPVEAPAVDDEHDDGPTTQAPAPRIASKPATASTPEPAPSTDKDAEIHRTQPRAKIPSQIDPPTRPGVAELETMPGVEAEPFDAEESITSRALGAQAVDDSVTQQAPNVASSLAASTGAAAIRQSSPSTTDGGDTTTTQKQRRSQLSPADGEPESITSQAPAHLTNLLRVIASDTPEPGVDAIDEDDDDANPQNQTAVMPNAPLKAAADASISAPPAKQPGTIQKFPPVSPIGARIDTRASNPKTAAAPRLEPLESNSDSGLRIARPATGSGERVSVGKLVADGEQPPEGAREAFVPSDGPKHASQSLHDIAFTKGPRYGLLVGVVAAVSILVPIVLFAFLNRSGDDPVPEPVTFAPNPVTRADGIRTKGRKGVAPPPSAQPSASAAASASARPKH
jgi:hypothetical protein